MLVFDDVTAHYVSFILQEEQLQSSEREKQTVQQKLRMKVNIYSEVLLYQDVMCLCGYRKNNCSQVRGRSCQRTEN